ncbi:MAG: DUF485 domain-containing protein [Herminiimonas sp.]|nr:DUF485 domain-containing protein [Herminiimonas sp.]
MPQSTIQTRIRQHPKFAETVSKSTRMAILLSFIVLIPYYTFMMITAYRPTILALPISERSIITVGWPVGEVLVIGAWLTTGFHNGMAIAGDYMSAATLLGLISLVYAKGVDNFIYTVSFFVGWPILLFLIAERLRNLGTFTFADIVLYRLDQNRIRTFAAFGSLTVVCFL